MKITFLRLRLVKSRVERQFDLTVLLVTTEDVWEERDGAGGSRFFAESEPR